MRFGPTSLQISSVLAKGLHRPKLREDLKISAQQVAGKASYVIKDPDTASYNRYGDVYKRQLHAGAGLRVRRRTTARCGMAGEHALRDRVERNIEQTANSNHEAREAGRRWRASLTRANDHRTRGCRRSD